MLYLNFGRDQAAAHDAAGAMNRKPGVTHAGDHIVLLDADHPQGTAFLMARALGCRLQSSHGWTKRGLRTPYQEEQQCGT